MRERRPPFQGGQIYLWTEDSTRTVLYCVRRSGKGEKIMSGKYSKGAIPGTTNLMIINRVLTLLETQTDRASKIDNLAIQEKLDILIENMAELTGWLERIYHKWGEEKKNG